MPISDLEIFFDNEIEHNNRDTLLLDRNINEAWQLWEAHLCQTLNNAFLGKFCPIRKRNYLHRKSQVKLSISNKVVSQLRSAKRSFVDSIPTQNTKQFWKAIQLLIANNLSLTTKGGCSLLLPCTVVSIPLLHLFP